MRWVNEGEGLEPRSGCIAIDDMLALYGTSVLEMEQ